MGFYKEGDRVEMSAFALKQGLNSGNRKYPATTKGTVVSEQRGDLITVRRDGRHCSSSYHAMFWVLINPALEDG